MLCDPALLLVGVVRWIDVEVRWIDIEEAELRSFPVTEVFEAKELAETLDPPSALCPDESVEAVAAAAALVAPDAAFPFSSVCSSATLVDKEKTRPSEARLMTSPSAKVVAGPPRTKVADPTAMAPDGVGHSDTTIVCPAMVKVVSKGVDVPATAPAARLVWWAMVNVLEL